MGRKKLVDQSSEELNAIEKKLKTALIILLVLIICFIGYSGYLVSVNQLTNTTLFIIVPVIFMVLSISISSKKSLVSSELRKREHN